MRDLLQRTAAPYDELIYPEDWRFWRDPEVPEWLDPAGWLLRHSDTPIADKPALICDGKMVTYAQLRERVAKVPKPGAPWRRDLKLRRGF